MLIIYNAHLVDKNFSGTGYVICENKKITKVELNKGEKPCVLQNAQFINAEGLTLMPAFIDMHAHFRYPGQPQKEDLDSGLMAAKNGGFGTLVLMPNTNPVISSYEQAVSVINEARSKKMSNIFQSVSITKNFDGTDTSHIETLNNSDIPVITEDGHDVLTADIMLDGMKKAAAKKIIVSCHCEDPTLAAKAKVFRQQALELMKQYKIPAWGVLPENTHVPEKVIDEISSCLSAANKLLQTAEDVCTYRNIELADLAGCKVHIAHVSTKNSIDCIRNAKAKKYKCTCEVTPHHLALSGTDFPKILALVNPPLRSELDRRALIEALRDGTADVISTDHAPHTAEDKANGAPGFTGSETAFAVCNTVLVKQENFSLNKLSELMSARPAEILGLKKGLLQAEYDADLVLVDENEKWLVNAADFSSKGKASPFDNTMLTGKVKALFVAGQKI